MLTSLYLHIPFCNQICTYCDFHKEIANTKKKQDYIYALCEELQFHSDKYTSLETIYIGGGTPSSLDLGLLETLLKTIKETIPLNNIIEYSIETNPNDLTKEFAELIFSYGVNRVSIGVQTFHQKHLTFLGRTHNQQDVYNGIEVLKETGFTNISVDMMFSLINQTLEELQEDITKVLALGINHISYYSLILEEKTKLYYMYEHDKVTLNEDDLEAKMYDLVINELESNGFKQYEISNFAKDGKTSLHNLSYWTNKEYLGLGSGSHSLYNKQRFFHINNVKEYISNVSKKQFLEYDYYEYDTITDEMILGLRLTKGISVSYIEEKYKLVLVEAYPKLNEFIQGGYLEIEKDYIRLTKKGIFVGNEIFVVFLEVV
jgi:oxygen-independent coproporphyrinogen-3 oxidase